MPKHSSRRKLKDSNMGTSVSREPMANSSVSNAKRSVISLVLSSVDDWRIINCPECGESTIILTSLSRDIIVLIPNLDCSSNGGEEILGRLSGPDGKDSPGVH